LNSRACCEMKILFIASDIQALGGIQQYNRKFLDAFRLRGSVRLVELKHKGVFPKARFISKSIFQGLIYNPDITVCAHINYATLGFFMRVFFGRKYIVCTHGVDVWEIESWLKRKAMLAATLITTVAEYTRDKIVNQLPEARDRIYLLYNPVDGSRFAPRKKSAGLVGKYGLENKKAILTVARLSAEEGYKGYDRVIKAMPQILKTVPNAVYFLIGDGDDAPRVRRLISEISLGNKVIMAGAYPNEKLPEYYNLADVFVMPSKAEGAPAVFVEALSCGIPVIAGNQDGSATPLQNGEVGLLIDPDSIEEIARAIIKVLTGRAPKNLLDRDFLRRKTLEKFGLDRFPERVNEMLSLFLAK